MLDPEFLPPEDNPLSLRSLSPKRKKFAKFVGAGALLSGILWCINEFTSIRGVNSVLASRIILIALWVLWFLLGMILFSELSRNKRVISILLWTIISAAALIAADYWAPRPPSIVQVPQSPPPHPPVYLDCKPLPLPFVIRKSQSAYVMEIYPQVKPFPTTMLNVGAGYEKDRMFPDTQEAKAVRPIITPEDKTQFGSGYGCHFFMQGQPDVEDFKAEFQVGFFQDSAIRKGEIYTLSQIPPSYATARQVKSVPFYNGFGFAAVNVCKSLVVIIVPPTTGKAKIKGKLQTIPIEFDRGNPLMKEMLIPASRELRWEGVPTCPAS